MADESDEKRQRTEVPESYYRIIDGKKYDRSLLEEAECFVKDGRISYAEAKKVIDSAKDGTGITDIERATLEYSLANHNYTNKAAEYVKHILATGKPPATKSYYKFIDKVRYDRELLETAEEFAKDGQVSFGEARTLWENAQDGKGLTGTERDTLIYALKHLKWTDKARMAMEDVLDIQNTAAEADKKPRGQSYYKQIDNVKYDRHLFEAGEKLSKDGHISYADAKELLEDAKDGKGITPTEMKTMEYILKNMKPTDKARNFLETELKLNKPGSYYKIVNGVKYDKDLLQRAEAAVKDGQISEKEAKELYESAKDGPGITACEKRTLLYTLETMKYTEPAKTFMTDALK